MSVNQIKKVFIFGPNYLRIWEIFYQEKCIKETHNTVIPLKMERDNKILGML